MRFKMITLGEKEVARIAGNAGTHADLMAATLTERWRKYLPKDQKVIDVLQLQLCVRDDLHRLRADIREIEHLHLKRLEGARLGREVRDVAIPQLRDRLIGIQRLFDGTFGAGSSTKVFGEDTVAIPRDPFTLLRVGHFARLRLTDSGFVLPETPFEGVKIVPRSLARSFEAPLATLEQSLEDLEARVPATNESLQTKIRTLNDLQTQAGIAARFLEALYFLAGHDEIARRVRPSTHRSREPGAVDGVTGAAGPEVDGTVDGATVDGATVDGATVDGVAESVAGSLQMAGGGAAQDVRRTA